MSGNIIFASERASSFTDDKLRKLDKEDLVLACISFGAKHVKIVGYDRQIAFFFVEEEVKKIIEDMLSGKDMQVNFHQVLRAQEIWRNAIVINKTENRRLS